MELDIRSVDVRPTNGVLGLTVTFSVHSALGHTELAVSLESAAGIDAGIERARKLVLEFAQNLEKVASGRGEGDLRSGAGLRGPAALSGCRSSAHLAA